jgi:hypothetical protein
MFNKFNKPTFMVCRGCIGISTMAVVSARVPQQLQGTHIFILEFWQNFILALPPTFESFLSTPTRPSCVWLGRRLSWILSEGKYTYFPLVLSLSMSIHHSRTIAINHVTKATKVQSSVQSTEHYILHCTVKLASKQHNPARQK